MPRRKRAAVSRAVPVALLLSAMAACSQPSPARDQSSAEGFDEAAETEAIRQASERMSAAWNEGDFEAYMDGFLNPDVVFVSRGRFQDGWQGTLDHYVRDYGASPEQRGELRFFDYQIWMLAPDAAQLITRFHLDRPEHPLFGINTRLMRKVGGKWVVALNHVSAVETPFEDSPDDEAGN